MSLLGPSTAQNPDRHQYRAVKCSANCGKGTQKRTVTCTNSQGKCDASTRPKAEEACEDYSGCYEWKTGDWSKCSSTCGKGLQSRVVQCMHKVTGRHGSECPTLSKPAAYRQCHQEVCNDKINVNTITSPRLAALTYKCTRDQWTVYCRVIREKNLCQDMRWYQRCCQTSYRRNVGVTLRKLSRTLRTRPDLGGDNMFDKGWRTEWTPLLVGLVSTVLGSSIGSVHVAGPLAHFDGKKTEAQQKAVATSKEAKFHALLRSGNWARPGLAS
ncbi:hypothetical protein A6R68_23616 [Neotoma lepida]|uniref:PLAC domain-containing protein n=1 Tax=Neotoma lepida TaxID=56216 RepID=A0A1A6HXF1_NEOLE|nr:hypothetical protein A6R68_23616 [Neotoma lepida]